MSRSVQGLINIETAIITLSLLVEIAGLDAHNEVYWRRAIERALGLSGRRSFNEKTPHRVQGSDHPFVSSLPSGLAPSRSLRLESVDTGVPPF